MQTVAKHQTFRSAIVRISFREFFYVLFFVTLMFVNGYLFLLVGVRNPWVYLIPVPALVAVTWAIALFAMRRRFPIRLEPNELVCCDWLCKYFPVSWESIYEAKAWPMMGLNYLRILSSESPRPLWFPLNVDNADQLEALIATYVEDDHPIVAELRRIR